MSSDISTNKKARRDYEILDTYECGMELKGTEVKSIRSFLQSSICYFYHKCVPVYIMLQSYELYQ